MTELNNDVVKTIDEINTDETQVIDIENNGQAMKFIIVTGVVVAVVTAAGVIYKKLHIGDKITEKRIRKLEKKGYIVFKREDLDTENCENDSDEDTEE